MSTTARWGVNSWQSKLEYNRLFAQIIHLGVRVFWELEEGMGESYFHAACHVVININTQHSFNFKFALIETWRTGGGGTFLPCQPRIGLPNTTLTVQQSGGSCSRLWCRVDREANSKKKTKPPKKAIVDKKAVQRILSPTKYAPW